MFVTTGLATLPGIFVALVAVVALVGRLMLAPLSFAGRLSAASIEWT
jgi:hypothetical protein